MISISKAVDEGRCAANIVAVVSDRKKAKGLEFARERGYPTAIVRVRDFEDRAAWDVGLAEKVAEFNPELVVLAGFMKIVGAPLLDRFPGRVINLHPALLPLFPGTDGPGMALEARVRVSGCTVHVVDRGVDTGPIIAQAAVRVHPNDDREKLHARIQVAEHRILPLVVDQIARGRIELSPELRLPDGAAEDTDILYSLAPDDNRP